uniref:maleylacetoacetate isomerase n=1 Tax=Ornithodoros turicata TaxID=34597 RepID=A0A2R5LGG8_9ACAR
MSSKPILYSYYRGSSWRARIVLALKNVDYEYRAVNLRAEGGGEQHSDDFKRINPMSQVPVLVVDGQAISQSVAIMEYLNEKYPEPKLLPDDLFLRAKTREIVEIIVSGVQPLQTPGLIPRIGEAEWRNWAKFFITKGFVAVEAILKATAGKYCVGDSVTLADAVLIPQLSNARMHDIDMAQFPMIARVAEALEKVPAFQVSHPCRQMDTPDNERK